MKCWHHVLMLHEVLTAQNLNYDLSLKVLVLIPENYVHLYQTKIM